jgi:integrase
MWGIRWGIKSFPTKQEEPMMAAKAFTRYPLKDFKGVFFILGTNPITGDPERVYYIRYRDPSGKMVEEPVGRSGKPDKMTPANARRLREKRIEGVDLPNRVKRAAKRDAIQAEARRWTINKLWTAWQEDPENQGKRGTVRADQRYRKHLEAPFGSKEPKDIIQTDIDRLRLSLAKNHSKETTRSVISLFRRIINYGFAKGYSPALSFPIVLKGKKLGKDPRVKRAPTDAEVAAYVTTCKAWPDRQEGDFMLFITYTGVRRGSARNLKWEDVDLENATAVLENSKTGTLPIMLNREAVELLRNHPRETDSPYVFTGRGWTQVLNDEGDPVLYKKNGKMRLKKEKAPMSQMTQRQIDRVPRRSGTRRGSRKPWTPAICSAATWRQSWTGMGRPRRRSCWPAAGNLRRWFTTTPRRRRKRSGMPWISWRRPSGTRKQQNKRKRPRGKTDDSTRRTDRIPHPHDSRTPRDGRCRPRGGVWRPNQGAQPGRETQCGTVSGRLRLPAHGCRESGTGHKL